MNPNINPYDPDYIFHRPPKTSNPISAVFRRHDWISYFRDTGPRPRTLQDATHEEHQADFMAGLFAYQRYLKNIGTTGIHSRLILLASGAPNPRAAQDELNRARLNDRLKEAFKDEPIVRKPDLKPEDVWGPSKSAASERVAPFVRLDAFAPRPFGAERHLVYLAGPMSGIPNHNAPEFARYAAALRDRGHFVFNPSENDMASGLINPEGTISATDRHKVLTVDLIKILTQCHLVLAMPGWEKSRGARMEMAVASECGITIGEVFLDLNSDFRIVDIAPKSWAYRFVHSSFGRIES
jgi:hypothetical protein